MFNLKKNDFPFSNFKSSFQIPDLLRQIIRSFVCLLFLIARVALANSPNGDLEFEIIHDERTRYYEVHLPKQFDPAITYPLVIALHGEKANARHIKDQTGFNAKADEAGFIVAYPQGTGRLKKYALTWNAANCCGYAYDENVDDVGFVETVIANLEAKYRIDPKRIFVTGFSNGGMLAFTLACRLSHKIAAIAPVAAAFNELECKPQAPISLIMFHGTEDKSVPLDGGISLTSETKRVDNSVATAITYWVRYNKCQVESDIDVMGKVTREHFSNGTKGTSVTLYLIRGGWHAWPGGKASYLFQEPPYSKISATDLIWDFFSKHPKQP